VERKRRKFHSHCKSGFSLCFISCSHSLIAFVQHIETTCPRFSFLDRGDEQALVHHGQADALPGEPRRKGLHQEEEQVVR
jgi:hypothetical protein